MDKWPYELPDNDLEDDEAEEYLTMRDYENGNVSHVDPVSIKWETSDKIPFNISLLLVGFRGIGRALLDTNFPSNERSLFASISLPGVSIKSKSKNPQDTVNGGSFLYSTKSDGVFILLINDKIPDELAYFWIDSVLSQIVPTRYFCKFEKNPFDRELLLFLSFSNRIVLFDSIAASKYQSFEQTSFPFLKSVFTTKSSNIQLISKALPSPNYIVGLPAAFLTFSESQKQECIAWIAVVEELDVSEVTNSIFEQFEDVLLELKEFKVIFTKGKKLYTGFLETKREVGRSNMYI
ncbi:hypothetical protein HK096_003702 [Nowakowskiella sp. JEL0078]|nr:hypothetical protein HK096_003702 [Nowakowskiella sp. JEL0078]